MDRPVHAMTQRRTRDTNGSDDDRASAPRFSYFDHEADIGIVGAGPSIEAAFEAAAAAMFAVMLPSAGVTGPVEIVVEFDEEDIELALVRWLNGLLAESRIRGLILSQFALSRHNAHWTGQARGAPWPPDADLGTEVKGATLTMLAVRPTSTGWEARCVVDV
jgi:SHS2 domain-containing protein